MTSIGSTGQPDVETVLLRKKIPKTDQCKSQIEAHSSVHYQFQSCLLSAW